jgi:2-polyprenyl-3-methyl-5-hydroxy-6-metoxy-1,4-benzoquinol methylase
VSRDELKREWIDLAPAWIREVREGVNPTRAGLLDGPILQTIGQVEGLRILDCGCGEGRFCRILADQGAEYVLGLDLCKPMIDAARELQSERDDYRVADVQDLGFLQPESFDLCISYLNHCDLPDFMANTREVFRILKPTGRFIVANLHPMRSAVGLWHRTPDGGKLHVILDRYFEESERHWRIMGADLTNFHRSLSTYIRGFFDAGFIMTDLIEPTISKDRLKRYPELDDELRVPNFIIYILQKP